MTKALDLILAEPWLIQSEALERILLIAQRQLDDPKLLALRDGAPMDNTRSVEIHGDAAVIPVRGPIFRYANLFTEISGATSLEVLARDFVVAQENPAINRLILAIDSPGGQATGIAEFAAIIRASAKPVTAYAGDMAASAAYWFAAAAERLVVSPTSLLGGLGVVSTFRSEQDGLCRSCSKKSGKIQIVSTQSPLKQADPRTPAGRAELQRVMDDLAAVFVSAVADYRGTNEETVLSDFGRGSLLVGAKAVSAGMADSVGSLASIIAGTSGPTSNEGFSMSDSGKAKAPEVTAEWLRANHPIVYASILKQGGQEAIEALGPELRAEGAETERLRIKAVREQSIPGHDALIERLAFDGQTSGEQAAVQILAAERQSLAAASRSQLEDRPAPVSAVEAPAGKSQTVTDRNLTVEDRCKAQWETDGAIRAEFGDLETYTAYIRAEEAGKVRKLGVKSA